MSLLEKECNGKLLEEHTNDAKFPYFGEFMIEPGSSSSRSLAPWSSRKCNVEQFIDFKFESATKTYFEVFFSTQKP